MKDSEFIVVVLFIMLSLIIGLLVGQCDGERRMKQELVEKGVAEYNSQTGEWQWDLDKEAENE